MPTISAFRTVLPKDGDFARGLEGLAAWPRVPVVLQPSGVAELDAVLGGGFPRGSLVELCGPASSGRTSLSLALLAEATQREEACAFVDVSDSLDPMSLAAAGVDIRRLLWIRCGCDEGNDPSHQVRLASASLPKEKDAEGSALLPSTNQRAASTARTRQAHKEPTNDGRGLYLEPANQTTGFLWQHPRNQMRGIETSIPSLVGGNQIGKNGNGFQSERPALVPSPEPEIDVVARCAGEQAEPDRQRSRRGENIRRRPFPSRQPENTTRQSHNPKQFSDFSVPFMSSAPSVFRFERRNAKARGTARHTKPWKRLEQALKATDLLLHSGGWGVVVFDLGSISWVDARRIPLSTWFRFQRIVENTPTILLLLGEEPCAKSCASLVLRCQKGKEKWSSVVPANGTWSPPGLARTSHQESLERRRHNVAQHGSAGNSGDTKTSPGRATQIASAQQSAVDPVSPHSVRTSGAACGEKCQLDIATFEGFEIQGRVVRSRRQLQSANSARWQTRTLWSGSF